MPIFQKIFQNTVPTYPRTGGLIGRNLMRQARKAARSLRSSARYSEIEISPASLAAWSSPRNTAWSAILSQRVEPLRDGGWLLQVPRTTIGGAGQNYSSGHTRGAFLRVFRRHVSVEYLFSTEYSRRGERRRIPFFQQIF